MDTFKRFGIKKSKAVMLFVQMILTLFLLAISIYLLVFVISNQLGGWMIASYILIILSVSAIIAYSIIGYKRRPLFYFLTVSPFAGAVFVNALMPNREAFQVALLIILFTLTIAFLLRQEDKRFISIVSIAMVVVALTFSIYSSAKANLKFLGEVADHWPTYVAMYSSIFVPTVMATTFALTYNVRWDRKKKAQE